MKINGAVWDKDFYPCYTPKELLELGIFSGKYMNDIKDKYPMEWFTNARMVARGEKPNDKLNLFKVHASLSLKEWKDKGWISEYDDHGWFQWYCNYFLGRRISDEDERQIKRWGRTVKRHSMWLLNNCDKDNLQCRPGQRQALLHWAWDSTVDYSKVSSEDILVTLKNKALKERFNKPFVFSENYLLFNILK